MDQPFTYSKDSVHFGSQDVPADFKKTGPFWGDPQNVPLSRPDKDDNPQLVCRGSEKLFEIRRAHPDSQNQHILELGLTDYQLAHRKQLELHSDVVSGKSEEVIVITEHYPVYTCGRRTKSEDRPVWTNIPIVDVERGGELTFHGPGQIVGYPILNLERRRLSIPRFLRKLEGALASALQQVGITAEYKEEHQAGLWVGGKKLVSIGIAVRRWVSFHGFALNVDCDLTPFQRIRPCGLSGDQVTSLKALGITIDKEEMQRIVRSALERNFF